MNIRHKLHCKHQSNKGVSLIEIIIVITIIAIASSMAIGYVGQLGYARTQRATKTINITLDKLRMETMSKGISYKLYLYQVEGDLYMKVQKESDSILLTKDNGEKLSAGCQVVYKQNGAREVELGDGKYIAISFTKSSGAFNSDYEWISINNGKHKSVLQFVKETGKHWVE